MALRQAELFDLPKAEAKRDEAMERVEVGAGSWIDHALECLHTVALGAEYLTTDDVWAILGTDSITDGRAMGPVVRKAAAQKWITKTGRTQKSVRTACNARPVTVWRSLIYGADQRAGLVLVEPDLIPVRHPDGHEVSPQTKRELWKEVRGPLMGSSDLAAIMGIDEYTGPWEVWDRIVLGRWKDKDTGDIRRGNRQEQNALARFREEFGLETRAVGMIRHPSDSRIVSDLDAMVIRPRIWPEAVRDNPLWDYVRTECKGNGALEAKCPRTAKFYQYRDEGMLKTHAIQMQHHMEVSGLEWGVLTFFNPEYDASIAFPVVREEKIGEWIRTQIPAWYARYVDTRERPMRPLPPPPHWPYTVPGEASVRDDTEWLTQAHLTTLRYYELLEAQEAYAETEKMLLALLDDTDQHVVGGGVVVTRKTTASRRQFDRGRFSAMLKLAQADGDIDRLMALDDQSEEFHYQTEGKDKIDVKVVGPNPLEME